MKYSGKANIQINNANLAKEEIIAVLKQNGFTDINISLHSQTKCTTLPTYWFDDYEFVFHFSAMRSFDLKFGESMSYVTELNRVA